MGCYGCEERRELAMQAVRAVRERNMRLAAEQAVAMGRSLATDIGGIVRPYTVRGNQFAATSMPPEGSQVRIRQDVLKSYARPPKPKEGEGEW